MWTALLSFLGSVISALPKIIDAVRDWKREKTILQEKQEKDARNEQAIRDASVDRSPR